MLANDEILIALAAQLRQPKGTKGIEVSEMMNETNISMTLHAIDRLHIDHNHRILELGHGNCGHLAYLLKQKTDIAYHGLEMSELMYQEAQRINEPFIDTGQASFHLYDGLDMPFPDHYFDRIFTVNTIYFWAVPAEVLSELHRIIKPGGLLNITFAQAAFMQQLPFTRFGFDLYDNEKITRLIRTTPFAIIALDMQTDVVKSKTGEQVNRVFTTITMQK